MKHQEPPAFDQLRNSRISTTNLATRALDAGHAPALLDAADLYLVGIGHELIQYLIESPRDRIQRLTIWFKTLQYFAISSDATGQSADNVTRPSTPRRDISSRVWRSHEHDGLTRGKDISIVVEKSAETH